MSTTLEQPQAPAPPAQPVLTPVQLIASYLRLRDKKKEIDDAHKAKMKPVDEMMGRIETMLLAHLNDAGADNLTSKGIGTAYKVTKTNVTVNGWSQTLGYIRDKEAWELLEARVSKTAAVAIIEETGADIPGVVVQQTLGVNIRRA